MISEAELTELARTPESLVVLVYLRQSYKPREQFIFDEKALSDRFKWSQVMAKRARRELRQKKYIRFIRRGKLGNSDDIYSLNPQALHKR